MPGTAKVVFMLYMAVGSVLLMLAMFVALKVFYMISEDDILGDGAHW